MGRFAFPICCIAVGRKFTIGLVKEYDESGNRTYCYGAIGD